MRDHYQPNRFLGCNCTLACLRINFHMAKHEFGVIVSLIANFCASRRSTERHICRKTARILRWASREAPETGLCLLR